MDYATTVGKAIWRGLKRPRSRCSRVPSTPIILAPFNLIELSQMVLDTLQSSLPRKHLALILRDPEDDIFRVRASRGYDEAALSIVQFRLSSPLIRHFSAHPVPTHYAPLERTPWLIFLPDQEREGLARLGGGLIMTLSTGSSLVGLLVVRQDKSGAIYRGTDRPLPEHFSRMVAIIEEAQLYQRLKKAQESTAVTTQQSPGMGQIRYPEHTASGIAMISTIFSLPSCLTPKCWRTRWMRPKSSSVHLPSGGQRWTAPIRCVG